MILQRVFILATAIFLALLYTSVCGQPCIMGRSDLEPTSPNPLPGLLIQQQGSASCDGLITSWTVCYYNPQNFSSRETFQISLEVWRNVSSNELKFINSNSVTVVLPDKVKDFQCVDILVSPKDRINVLQNDLLAVFILRSTLLPVATANAGGSGSLYFLPVTAVPPDSVFLFGNRNPLVSQLHNQGLHITATIKTEMEDPVTMNTFSPNVSIRNQEADVKDEVILSGINGTFNTTDEAIITNPFKDFISSRIFIVVVATALLLLICILIVLASVVVFLWRRKRVTPEDNQNRNKDSQQEIKKEVQKKMKEMILQQNGTKFDEERKESAASHTTQEGIKTETNIAYAINHTPPNRELENKGQVSKYVSTAYYMLQNDGTYDNV